MRSSLACACSTVSPTDAASGKENTICGTAGSLTIVSGCDAANPDTPRVLGVHMVSQMASDIIAEAEQLVGNHVPLADAARLVHPHPTFSETLGEALLKADGRPLHTR